MTEPTAYLPHSLSREDRADGTIILRSGFEMGAVAPNVGAWLDRWASEAPDRVFLAERSGEGWREVSFGEARQRVRAIASGLLARSLGSNTPIMILSGNSVDHGLLALAAQYVGVPIVPLAEQYSLIPAAQSQITYCAGLVAPRLVYAEDGTRFGAALALDVFDGVEKIVSHNAAEEMTDLADLQSETNEAAVDAAAAQVGPDTVAKYLMTSGSTSSPKGVITTHRMMCANQTQLADTLAFLRARPPVIVDWLPWNHVFGGSHNFNMMLAYGGSLYIDAGKPVKHLVGTTIENLGLKSGTISFNVPLGYAMLRDAMKADRDLRHRFFADLDMIFYAGASLPQDVWADLEDMAREVRGDVPLMNSSWGLTETAPACLIVHEPIGESGIVGVPVTGLEVKLIPDEEMRCEIRVRGPNLTPGYLHEPEKTAEAFDDEGFFITGDAMKFVDEARPESGLRFDGRMSEDFKLTSGTWVRAANLRMELLDRLGPLAQDIVICGADRADLGLMVFPGAAALDMVGADDNQGTVWSEELEQALRTAMGDQGSAGSASRIARMMVLSEPAQIGEGEITAKGNLNFRKIQTRRAELLEALYADDGTSSVIRL